MKEGDCGDNVAYSEIKIHVSEKSAFRDQITNQQKTLSISLSFTQHY